MEYLRMDLRYTFALLIALALMAVFLKPAQAHDKSFNQSQIRIDYV
jgi:hypothetical protein|tara:strand:+ start:1690 stop:1827 length:138 start_codon:yes stop_codon:yes gene_type:complete